MGVSGNVHECFMSWYDAEQAYTLAYALGAMHCLGQQSCALPAPPPAGILVALKMVGDDFLGNKWHIVYKEKQPCLLVSELIQIHCLLTIMMNCRTFAVNQMIYVLNIFFEKYGSCVDAERAYTYVAAAGETVVL